MMVRAVHVHTGRGVMSRRRPAVLVLAMTLVLAFRLHQLRRWRLLKLL